METRITCVTSRDAPISKLANIPITDISLFKTTDTDIDIDIIQFIIIT